MNILILMTSPHSHGTTSVLCDSFARGAAEMGHQVDRIDTSKLEIHPCNGCGSCHISNLCIQKDEMQIIYKKIQEADLVVFGTPVYFYNISAQLKLIFDRLYCCYKQLHPKYAVLLSVCANPSPQSHDTVKASYKEFIKCTRSIENLGFVGACGISSRDALLRTSYPQMAYELGKSIK